MLVGVGVGACALTAGILMGYRIYNHIEQGDTKIAKPMPKWREKKPQPASESLINTEEVKPTMKPTQEDADFDEMMNEAEYGEQVATLEKLGMHELADDTIAVGVEEGDSSEGNLGKRATNPTEDVESPPSRSPKSLPRCDTCGKLAKHQPANDGNYYCKAHAPEELLQ